VAKKGGILNPALSHLLASTGHTDYFTICDRGYPVPSGPERIDLALVDGIPTVLDVLRAVAAEWHLDRVVIAVEMTEISPQRVDELRAILGDVPLQVIPHLELKRLSQTGKATVRTGDSVPYANIVVVSG
jgi:D-ribose pyranase